MPAEPSISAPVLSDDANHISVDLAALENDSNAMTPMPEPVDIGDLANGNSAAALRQPATGAASVANCMAPSGEPSSAQSSSHSVDARLADIRSKLIKELVEDAEKAKLVSSLEAVVLTEGALIRRLEAKGFVQPIAKGSVHERANIADLNCACGRREASRPSAEIATDRSSSGGVQAGVAPSSSRAVLPKLKAPLPRASRGIAEATKASSRKDALATGGTAEGDRARTEDAAARGLVVARSKLKLRVGASFESPEAGDLPAGSHVLIIERQELFDGTQRACVVDEGATVPRGWVSVVGRDGAENLLSPTDPRASALVAALEAHAHRAMLMAATRATRLSDVETPYTRRHGDPSELILQSVTDAKLGRRNIGMHSAVQRNGTVLGQGF